MIGEGAEVTPAEEKGCCERLLTGKYRSSIGVRVSCTYYLSRLLFSGHISCVAVKIFHCDM